jgi:hypothetical protein
MLIFLFIRTLQSSFENIKRDLSSHAKQRKGFLLLQKNRKKNRISFYRRLYHKKTVCSYLYSAKGKTTAQKNLNA